MEYLLNMIWKSLNIKKNLEPNITNDLLERIEDSCITTYSLWELFDLQYERYLKFGLLNEIARAKTQSQ